MVRRVAKSPFCHGRVTLLARPTFPNINTEARSHPSQLGQDGRPSEHARVLLAWAKESTIFSLKKRSLDRVIRTGKWGGGGISPCKPYRYVPLQRVGFSGVGLVFNRTTEVYERICSNLSYDDIIS